MMSHYTQLVEHVISKAEDQLLQINELNYIKSEFEQKLLESNSIITTMETEIKTQGERIAHLEADAHEFENSDRVKQEELRQANDEINSYQEINKQLQQKVEKLELEKKTGNELKASEHGDLML